jgi:hypothetical protein
MTDKRANYFNNYLEGKMAKINWYRNYSAFIPPDNGVDVIERSLEPLSQGIKECVEYINKISSIEDVQYKDLVIDEETTIIENLIGTSFVLCQTYISFIVSRIIKLHDSVKSMDIKLTTSNSDKISIMHLGVENIPDTNISFIQLIDASANYFKHQDEWPDVLWEKIQDKRILPTLTTIQSIGFEQFSTGNLRTASRVLGNPKFENLEVFSGLLRNWGLTVHALYDDELTKLGLLSR